MSFAYRTKRTRNSILPGILLALAIGWVIYLFISSDTHTPLRNIPPFRPSIVARAEWGARPLNLEAPEEFGLYNAQNNPGGVLYYTGNLSAVLNTIVVHHSAYPDTGPEEVQDLHMQGRGFADVAYHFLIDSDGIIYEGRKINIRGAHVRGFNTGSVGIVLLGNFNETSPKQTQMGSLEKLVDHLRYTYEIRYLAGHKGYPDQSPDGTECPGDSLYGLLPDLASSLGMKYGIDGYIGLDGSNN